MCKTLRGPEVGAELLLLRVSWSGEESWLHRHPPAPPSPPSSSPLSPSPSQAPNMEMLPKAPASHTFWIHVSPPACPLWYLDTDLALSRETKSKPALTEPASELESHLTAVPGVSATAEQGEMCERCSATRWGLDSGPPIYQVDSLF